MEKGGNADGGAGGVAKDGTIAEAGTGNIGGFGGCAGSGCALKGWSNSSLTSRNIDNDGQGGSNVGSCPGGGGGGGVGGGGAGAIVSNAFLGISGAGGGGGSLALQSTETCSSAPTSKPALPNAGSCGDDNTCDAGNVGEFCINDSPCDTQPGGEVRLVFFNDSDC